MFDLDLNNLDSIFLGRYLIVTPDIVALSQYGFEYYDVPPIDTSVILKVIPTTLNFPKEGGESSVLVTSINPIEFF